ITVTITGHQPGETFCFNVTFANPRIEECCQIQHCVTLPECDCEQFPVFRVTCDPATGGYVLTFTVQNLTALPINELHIFPQPPGSGVVVTPANFFFPNVPQFGTAGPFNATITNVTPGPLCFLISIHYNGRECCAEEKCVTLPSCGLGQPCPAD